MKRLAVLGSTGSIGQNTLEVISGHPDRFRVSALAVNNNVLELESQIKKFNPDVVAIFDESAAEGIKKKNLPVEILTGEKGLIEVATLEGTDMVVSAIVGSAGLMPTFAAIKAGKDIALATKEALVMAGKIVMSEASNNGVRIIPVDSEHSAVFQCLDNREMEEVEKIVLTASGGPFLKKSITDLENVTLAEALNHPNWDMGRKISIDSATLMNKGLEVIEAFWLFNVPVEKIGVILHPQSIIHSMVNFIDGTVIAQMSVPDMKGPISYALSYPKRFGNVLPPLNLAEVGELTFEEPDLGKYPSLSLTFEALKKGGTMPCVLNAANEAAVDAFLNESIPFTEITRVVSETMAGHEVLKGDSIEEVISVSGWARQKAEEIIEKIG
ncbi:MAG TPA: 1-deoxy-D-xylulose-5-phosphate reductoisomerase [Nitrospirae bacterium]|nr:1-deoxy-D-xylulose 5-phosphate reductoisomerase [bacterium BMS3Abin06]HDH11581.1 1-deoxy-D-xylulose-5-phosphate reductoisomerase [Nitrospirota bacterium]HDZ01962.1 1-deoxy-D-xylulose-5-phosphate reductoisomerase [Nitrospirota bacterium]